MPETLVHWRSIFLFYLLLSLQFMSASFAVAVASLKHSNYTILQ